MKTYLKILNVVVCFVPAITNLIAIIMFATNENIDKIYNLISYPLGVLVQINVVGFSLLIIFGGLGLLLFLNDKIEKL